MKSIDTLLLEEANNNEMNSLKANKTWILTYLPLVCRSIKCKWFL